jgi:hypothetical protein
LLIFFSFDELAIDEPRAGADEGDEVRRVDGAPTASASTHGPWAAEFPLMVMWAFGR